MTQDIINIVPSLFDNGWEDIELDRSFRTGIDRETQNWLFEINPRGRLAWNANKALQKRDDVLVVVYARDINILFVRFDIHLKAGHVEFYATNSRTLLISAVEEPMIDMFAREYANLPSTSVWKRPT